MVAAVRLRKCGPISAACPARRHIYLIRRLRTTCCLAPRHRGGYAQIPSPAHRGFAMKITGTRTQIVLLPADEPLAGAADNPTGKRPIVTLRVATDAGVEGIGVAYFGGHLTRTLAQAIDELGALCVGEDPVRVEA